MRSGWKDRSQRVPRLLLDEDTAKIWESSEQPANWLLSRSDKGQAELLWLLPPKPEDANGQLIGEVCATALRLIRDHAGDPRFGHHYLGYLDLVTRSLQILLEKRSEEGSIALKVSELRTQAAALQQSLLSRMSLEAILLTRLQDLAK